MARKDDGFVKDKQGSTKFRLIGDTIHIHWIGDGTPYRTESAWFREESWAAEVKRLRSQVRKLRAKVRELTAGGL